MRVVGADVGHAQHVHQQFGQFVGPARPSGRPFGEVGVPDPSGDHRLLVTDRPDARTRRRHRDVEVGGREHLDVVADHRQRLVQVAGVDVHLPAAHLRRREDHRRDRAARAGATVALGTSGNRASPRQVAISAIRMASPSTPCGGVVSLPPGRRSGGPLDAMWHEFSCVESTRSGQLPRPHGATPEHRPGSSPTLSSRHPPRTVGWRRDYRRTGVGDAGRLRRDHGGFRPRTSAPRAARPPRTASRGLPVARRPRSAAGIACVFVESVIAWGPRGARVRRRPCSPAGRVVGCFGARR